MISNTQKKIYSVSFIIKVEECEKGDSCTHLVHLIQSEASIGLRPDSPERNFTIWWRLTNEHVVQREVMADGILQLYMSKNLSCTHSVSDTQRLLSVVCSITYIGPWIIHLFCSSKVPSILVWPPLWSKGNGPRSTCKSLSASSSCSSDCWWRTGSWPCRSMVASLTWVAERLLHRFVHFVPAQETKK